MPYALCQIVPHVTEKGYRWLKQYSVGGLPCLVKMGQSTGRSRTITRGLIAEISKKLSEESCEFTTYKEIAAWVEENSQISVKYQTLHKQVHYRMKAKLKVPRPASLKKDNLLDYNSPDSF
jgi:hypothetical protein